MNKKINKILFLVGSPRAKKSTSYSIGNFLIKSMEKDIIDTETTFIQSFLKNEKKFNDMEKLLKDTDLIILSFPLYVDSLPAAVIRFLQKISESNILNEKVGETYFLSISNSGFPEAKQNYLVKECCKQFALENDLIWLEGISVGMGGTINGQPLEELGGMTKKLRENLEKIAIGIIESNSVEKSLINEIEKGMIPSWLYILFGNIGWRFEAIKNGTFFKLNSKPFKE